MSQSFLIARLVLLDPGNHPGRDGDAGVLSEGLPQEPEEGVVAPLAETADPDNRGGNGAEDDGVDSLASTGGSHQSADQAALQPLGLESNHDDRIRELPREESAYSGEHHLPQRTEGHREGGVMGHRVGVGESRKGDDGPEAQHGENCADKPHDDRAARGLDPVDLGGDVSHDVGQWEQEEAAVGGDRT